HCPSYFFRHFTDLPQQIVICSDTTTILFLVDVVITNPMPPFLFKLVAILLIFHLFIIVPPIMSTYMRSLALGDSKNTETPLASIRPVFRMMKDLSYPIIIFMVGIDYFC
ncbi:hypothetical protein LINGRAHAP2_LOCUS7044, partial [Linum grandiflorum]